MGPSPEGLSRKLAEVVAHSPERFAVEVSAFIDIDPVYISGVISGLNEATKENTLFPWAPVLEFCDWCNDRSQTSLINNNEHAGDGVSWSWIRGEISNLLRSGFSKDLIPFDLCQMAWAVLEPITNDPEPTPEYERQSGEPSHVAINTARGKAMIAVIEYGLWKYRHVNNQHEEIDQSPKPIHELRKVLDWHLSNDPSLAIRAVFGMYFPGLLHIDLKWISENIDSIFPEDEEQYHMWEAAWDAYILYNHPYDNVLGPLDSKYKLAIGHMGKSDTNLPSKNRDIQLVTHLMTFYWRGLLDLNEEESLLIRFYDGATDEVCAAALRFIGTSLRNTEGDIELPALERLKKLWLKRFDVMRQKPESHVLELAEFEWWLISGKFDDLWAVKQFKEVLTTTHIPDMRGYSLVFESLAKLSANFPEDISECLRLIIDNKPEAWIIRTSMDSLREILSKSIGSDSEVASQTAKTTINLIAARYNIRDLRDLL